MSNVEPVHEPPLAPPEPVDPTHFPSSSAYPYSGKDQLQHFDKQNLMNLHFHMTASGNTTQGPMIDLGQVGSTISFFVPKSLDQIPQALHEANQFHKVDPTTQHLVNKHIADFTHQKDKEEKEGLLFSIAFISGHIFSSIENLFRHHFKRFIKARLQGRKSKKKTASNPKKRRKKTKQPTELYDEVFEDEEEGDFLDTIKQAWQWLTEKDERHPLEKSKQLSDEKKVNKTRRNQKNRKKSRKKQGFLNWLLENT